MAIAHVQSGGTNANNTTSVARAFSSNVTSGSLIVVVGMKFSPSNDAYVAGDCTKSAGTATIGTIALDHSANITTGGTNHAAVGIWSAIVTGTGSCTMQTAGAAAGSYLLIGSGEFSGSWDASRLEAGVSGAGTGSDGDAAGSSGNASSAGAGLFIGGLSLETNVGGTITPDAAFTAMYENEASTDANGSAIYQIVGGATTDAAEWTFTTNNNGYGIALAVYKEAAGAATSILRQMMMHHGS
jgi:hypothetical protein